MIINHNTPSAGYISWSGVSISYKGQVFNVADGNTNLTYIFWKYADPLGFYGSNALPTLGPDDLLVFLNKQGSYVLVPNATVLDGSLIVPESILANQIAANAITSEKIAANSVSSEKVLADAITAYHIEAGSITTNEIAAGTILANNIAAGAIGADQIAANAILAQKIAIGDFTNLVQINELSNPNGNPVVTLSSKKYFQLGPATNSFLEILSSPSLEFKLGDRLLFAYYGYRSTSLATAEIRITYHYTDGTTSLAGVGALPTMLTLGELLYSAEVGVTSSPASNKTIAFVSIRIVKTSSSGYCYLRNMELRMMYSGKLIVEGSITAREIAANSITANQLDVTSLSAISADLGTVTAGNITGVEISGSVFRSPIPSFGLFGMTLEDGYGVITDGSDSSLWNRFGFSIYGNLPPGEPGSTLREVIGNIPARAGHSGGYGVGAELTDLILRSNTGDVVLDPGTGKIKMLGTIENESIITPTFINGWTHFSTISEPWQRGGYWKDKNGIVHLVGLIKGGTTANGTILFTLPVGYRPAKQEVFIVTTINGTARIDVYPNGQVIGARDLNATWTSLSGMSLKAA